MKKMIEFSLRDSIAYMNSSSLTTMKLFMSTPPFIKINWLELDPDEKYNKLMEVFAGSKEGVPVPANPREYNKMLLEKLGFSNWKMFFGKGRHCSIQLDETTRQFEFVPMIYLKENNGLYGIKSGTELISSSASPEEIVNKLEMLLDKLPILEQEYHKNDN